MADARTLADLLDTLESAGADPTVVDALANHPDLLHLAPADALRAARALVAAERHAELPKAAQLAQQAHEADIEGAGPTFAQCVDRLSLLNQRPQPFGTVTVEHNGETMLAPVDPQIDDDDRARYGIPPLGELRAAAQRVSVETARRRAEAPGLPPGARFARVWRDHDPSELRARRAQEGAPGWADDDVLTLVSESPGPVAVTPVFEMVTWDAGDGLQVLDVRVERLAEAVITYTFTALGGARSMSMRRGSHDGRFRGPDAPPERPSNEELVGTSFDHALESASLGEPRPVTVYLPPGHSRGEGLPVVYSTDGNMISPYLRRLDAAIEAGTCPRVVVVGAHAAPADQRGNFRAMEYLPGFDDRRFDNHQRFFVDELARWAEAELGVSDDRSGRAVFGCSDGGGHALATAMGHHDRFGHVFAYSTGMPPDERTRWDVATYPRVQLCAGTLEMPFHLATSAWAGFLGHIGADHDWTERVCGHDLIQWCEELPNAIVRAFG